MSRLTIVTRLGALGLSLTLALAGCTSHPLSAPTPAVESEAQRAGPVEVVKKLDLLFLVDDSQSMSQEQASLRTNFPLFMQRLESAGLSDLRVAVISSDFGAGARNDAEGCQGRGDGGRLLVKPGCGLPDGGDRFLAVGPSVPGGRNFTGTLPAAFSCLADLGTGGCGFEHQLQSLRYALHGEDGRAFLRPDANLGIVLVTDEDDCSGIPESTLYTEDRPGEDPNLRCATAGHVCGGMPVTATRMEVPLASCQAVEHGNDEVSRRTKLINVSEIVEHVRAAKAGTGRRVIVSAIFGWSTAATANYEVASGGTGGALGLTAICSNGGAWAMPAVRLKTFVDAFGAEGSWQSICTDDLGPALTKIGEAIASFDPTRECLPGPPVDIDRTTPGIQADCVAVDRNTGPGGAPVETRLPACSAGQPPCWELAPDPTCPGGVRPLVRRLPGAAAEGTVERIRCAICNGTGTSGCPAPSL